MGGSPVRRCGLCFREPSPDPKGYSVINGSPAYNLAGKGGDEGREILIFSPTQTLVEVLQATGRYLIRHGAYVLVEMSYLIYIKLKSRA